MKKTAKIATAIGCLSLAIVGGLVMSACGSKAKEISKEEFTTYIGQTSTVLNFNNGIHGLIQTDVSKKVEFWILKKTDQTYNLKQVESTLVGTEWTSQSTYVKDGKIYEEKDGRKICSTITDYSGETFMYSLLGFDEEAMNDIITGVTENATDYTEKTSKNSKTYNISQDTESLEITFNNDKLVKLNYSHGEQTNLLEEFNGQIYYDINLADYYQGVDNFDDLKQAVKTDSKIVLTDDIRMEETLTIDKNITIDLDVCTLTVYGELTTGKAMFNINGGSLTILGEDGTVQSKNGLAVFNVETGTLTIKSGTYENRSDVFEAIENMEDVIVNVENGTAIIENGHFSVSYGDEKEGDEIYQAKQNMFKTTQNGKIEITGGEFEYFNPQEQNLVPDSHQATDTDQDNTWTVSPKNA